MNVIGFDLAPDDRAQFQAVAGAGGGVFEEVDPDRAAIRAGAIADARMVARGTARNARMVNTGEMRNALMHIGGCTHDAISQEHADWLKSDVGNAMDARQWRDGSAVTRARHDAFRTALQAVQAVGTASLDATNAAIDKALAEIEAELGEAIE